MKNKNFLSADFTILVKIDGKYSGQVHHNIQIFNDKWKLDCAK